MSLENTETKTIEVVKRGNISIGTDGEQEFINVCEHISIIGSEDNVWFFETFDAPEQRDLPIYCKVCNKIYSYSLEFQESQEI